MLYAHGCVHIRMGELRWSLVSGGGGGLGHCLEKPFCAVLLFCVCFHVFVCGVGSFCMALNLLGCSRELRTSIWIVAISDAGLTS